MLETLALSALTAFIPAAIDGVKGLFNKFSGGAQAQPANFAEYLQAGDLEINRLEAIAKLDQPGSDVSRWVNNLRASSRYIIAYAIIVVWCVTAVVSIWVFVDDSILMWIGGMASSVMFFMFGDRVNMHLNARSR